jgi:hypothetical protein
MDAAPAGDERVGGDPNLLAGAGEAPSGGGGNPAEGAQHTTDRSRADTIALLYRSLSLETAKAISRAERQEEGYTSSTLAYSEIEFDPFIQVDFFICIMYTLL